MILGQPLITERFYLRSLAPGDVGDHYLAWLRDDLARMYISAASQSWSIESLRAFVEVKSSAPGVLFLGIFLRDTDVHIGNIKIERIDPIKSTAELGVLVGDSRWRGKGVFPEIFASLQGLLHESYGVSSVFLGVSKSNPSAIRTYLKSGFCEVDPGCFSLTPTPDSLVMVADIFGRSR